LGHGIALSFRGIQRIPGSFKVNRNTLSFIFEPIVTPTEKKNETKIILFSDIKAPKRLVST
jgi:hypothetical protein